MSNQAKIGDYLRSHVMSKEEIKETLIVYHKARDIIISLMALPKIDKYYLKLLLEVFIKNQ